jgi:hypothetical protein
MPELRDGSATPRPQRRPPAWESKTVRRPQPRESVPSCCRLAVLHDAARHDGARQLGACLGSQRKVDSGSVRVPADAGGPCSNLETTTMTRILGPIRSEALSYLFIALILISTFLF